MKKITICVVFLLLCSMISSCRVKEEYKLLNSFNEISDISITEISFENNEIIQTQITSIDDISGFMDDFKKVKCYTYFGDPLGVTQEGVSATVIKIIYENEEYELVNWSGQSECTDEYGFSYYAGFNVFDEKQFEELILKYKETQGNTQNTEKNT